MSAQNPVATRLTRDCRVYYARCPEVPFHFILADPESPCWEITPPQSPILIECRGCGEHHQVRVTEPWKLGWVSPSERDQLLALREPTAPGLESIERHPYKGLIIEVEVYRQSEGGYFAWPYIVRSTPTSVSKAHFVLGMERLTTKDAALNAAIEEGRKRIDGGFEF